MGDVLGFLTTFIIIVLAVLALASSAIKIVQEYERGVIFRLGRLVGRGAGLFVIIPFVDRMVKVDLRVVTLEIPAQEAITRDNVTVKVNAVAYFRVGRSFTGDCSRRRLSAGDMADRADHFALSAGPVGPGRTAHPPRGDQPTAAAHHRPADGALGHQGQRGGGQGRRTTRHAETGHGSPGGSRAQERAKLSTRRASSRLRSS